MTVRFIKLVPELTYLSPSAARNESLRWQTIWDAVIRPHCRGLSARNKATRRRISWRSDSASRVFTAPLYKNYSDFRGIFSFHAALPTRSSALLCVFCPAPEPAIHVRSGEPPSVL